MVIDIEIAEDCMNTTMTRQSRLRTLIEEQKRIQDYTYSHPLPIVHEDEQDQEDFRQCHLCELSGIDQPSSAIYNGANHEAPSSLGDFKIIKVLGKGSFGTVFLVQKTKGENEGKYYAMKTLRKIKILEYKMVESTLLEKEILESFHHPFLVKLEYAFQTDDTIFFVLDFVRGGELWFHLAQVDCFPEIQAQFYAA